MIAPPAGMCARAPFDSQNIAYGRSRDQVATERFVSQIAGHGDGSSAGVLDERDDLAGVALLGRQIVDGDVGPFASERYRRRAADAGVAARSSRGTASRRMAP